MRIDAGRAWLRGIAVIGALFAFLLLNMTPAFAADRVRVKGVGGSVVPNFPANVSVGQTVPATITISNDSDTPNDTENVNATNILFTPSCGSGTFFCAAPDPGVFSVANGVGTFGCTGTTFTASAPDVNGQITFTPSPSPVVLGPADLSGGANSNVCRILFTVTVLKLPTVNAGPGPALQTKQIANVDFEGVTSGLTGGAAGTDTTTVLTPTLTIAKTPDGQSISPGQTATFTIVVTNTGAGVATAVVIDDPLPAGGGLTWGTATPNCTVLSNALHCDVGTLASGASFTAVVSAVTSVQACTTLPNTASTSATGIPAVTDPGLITCVPIPVLSIAKTPDGGIITAGQTATFTIVATNNGPGPANNVTIDDPLPGGGGVTWQTGSVGCSITGPVGTQVLACSFGTLAAGASATAVATAVTSTVACAQMNNTAIVSASNAAPVADSGSIACQVPVLAIAKTPDGTSISAGAAATFTIVVTNNGPGTANGVAINDPLPAGGGVNWTTSTAGCSITGAVSAQTLTCTVGSLAQGAAFSATVSAVTTAQACTLMNNTATASATNAVSVQDTGSINCQSGALQIAKTPDGSTISAGQTATFTIVVTNTGAGTVTGVTLTDSLPAGGGVNWTTSSAGCTVTGVIGTQSLNCTIGSLAPGASATAVVSAVTSPQACAVMNNTATVTSTNAGSATDTGSITCQVPVLAITKTPDGAAIGPGATATFTIVLTNNGPGAATGVAISDPLPAGGGVTWSTSSTGCTVAGAVGAQTLSCTVGSLAQGASFTAAVSAVTSGAACAAMNNTATASATNAISVQDAGSITCSQNPQLTITKTPDGQIINPGSTAIFSILVTSSGIGAVDGVAISDPLPAGGGVNWTTSATGCAITGAAGSQTLNCTVGTLAQGASFSATVSAATSVTACTTMNNTATATASNAPTVTDTGTISCVPPQVATIPTLSEWAMLLLVSLLVGSGFVVLRRRSML